MMLLLMWICFIAENAKLGESKKPDRSRFGCCISAGEYGLSLENSQKWWDTADFDVFFDDLERELELRIPDKFLKAKGWYKEPKE